MATLYQGLLLFLVCFRVIFGNMMGPLTWDKARERCEERGEIISPISSSNDEWTPNYLLNLGCVQGTDICEGIIVEKVPASEQHRSLCSSMERVEIDNKTTPEMACKLLGNGYTLMSINSMQDLLLATPNMRKSEQYWVQALGANFAGDSFVKECEIHRTKQQQVKSNCHMKYTFSCVPGQGYNTVIAIINLEFRPPVTTESLGMKGNLTNGYTNGCEDRKIRIKMSALFHLFILYIFR